MSKNKAIVCTVLFTMVWFGVLFGIICWRDGVIYQYITSLLAGLWAGNIILRFYNWLRKDD